MDVLKCRVYCYSGRARPTDQESTATEKMVCRLQFPRGGGAPCQAGAHGGAPGVHQEAGRAGGRCGARDFCRKEQVRQCKQTYDGLV